MCRRKIFRNPASRIIIFSLPGVYNVTVGLLAQKAEVLYDPDETNEETLKNHIEALGFGASILQNHNLKERIVEFEVS